MSGARHDDGLQQVSSHLCRKGLLVPAQSKHPIMSAAHLQLYKKFLISINDHVN